MYQPELYAYIGDGNSSWWFFGFCTQLILATLIVFTPKRVEYLKNSLNDYTNNFILINASKCILLLFYIVIYVDLFRHPIPFFKGIDRVEYLNINTGIIIRIVLRLVYHICFYLGVMFYQIYKLRRKINNMYLYFLVLTLIYLFLIGHKYSTPFMAVCSFLVPVGLLLLDCEGFVISIRKNVKTTLRNNKLFNKINNAHVLWWSTIFVSMFSIAVFQHILVKYQTKEHIKNYFVGRIFVGQGKVWWTTYNRVIRQKDWNLEDTIDKILLHPLYEYKGNTSLVFLMHKTMGHKTYDRVKSGFLYTGAYPAILLELFGPFFSYLAAFLMALIYCWLLYFVLKYIVTNRYLNLLFLYPIYYKIFMFNVDGGVNFLKNTFFYLAVSVFLLLQFSRFTLSSRRKRNLGQAQKSS